MVFGYGIRRLRLLKQTMALIVMIMIIGSIKGEQDIRPVQATDILAKIKAGSDVACSNCIVEGDLNISTLNLSIIYSQINIKNCSIKGDVNFSNVKFKKPVKAENVNFNKFVSFNGTQFDSFASFENDTFKRQVNFRNVAFFNDAWFNRAIFVEKADFEATNFIGFTSFNSVQFYGDAIFNKAQFGSYANFVNVFFKKHSYFDNSKFQNITYFTNSKFLGISNFNGTHFNKFIFCDEVQFSDDANFLNSQFDDANFINSWFQKRVDFGNTIFNESAKFNGVRFDNDAYFRSTKFGNYFYLDGAQVKGDLVANWDSINNKLRCDRPVYMKLLRYFRDIEDKRAEDECYYDYRFFRLFGVIDSYESRSDWDTLSDLIWWISCGFGVKPFNTIGLSILLILSFSTIYKIFDVPLINQSNKVSIEQAFFFSASIFVKWLPHKDWTFSSKKRWRYAVLIEVILGMILFILFVVTMGHVLVH